MKQLLITIAAVLVVGCGTEKKYAGKYFVESESDRANFELKENGLLTMETPSEIFHNGNCEREENLIILKLEIQHEENTGTLFFHFDKTSFKMTSMISEGEDKTKQAIDNNGGKDVYLKKVGGLRKCKTCKNQVSVEAKSCPHCGQPDPAY